MYGQSYGANYLRNKKRWYGQNGSKRNPNLEQRKLLDDSNLSQPTMTSTSLLSMRLGINSLNQKPQRCPVLITDAFQGRP